MLKSLPLAMKVATTTVMFVIPYSLFEQTQLMITNHNGRVMDKAFGADVTLTVRMIDEHLACFKKKMIELTRGKIEFITLEQRENTILPLGK
jgi:putative IMPACT (imprinted ancient) family translation regulator